MRFAAIACLLLLCSCASIPKIKMPGVGKVSAFRDAGSPATMAEGTEKTGMRIPANSKVTVRKTEELPSEGVLLPSNTEWTFELTEPTDFMAEARRIQASTGTRDQKAALAEIEAKERRPLLYLAILGILGGFTLMYLRFPALAVMSFAGAVAFFFAWRMAEISGWVGALFLVGAIVGFFFYMRGELDKDNDGVPDILQKKKKEVQKETLTSTTTESKETNS